MRKILVVEDEHILRETYRLMLSTQPYDCDFAEDGIEALEMCEQKKYDLILLDIMMPKMDGIGFLKTIKDNTELKAKVIVMSNLSAGKEIDQVRELGVQKCILKSDMSPKQLVSMIRLQFDS